MKIYKIVIFTIYFLSSFSLVAQSYREHRGDIYFDRFNYTKAVDQYLQVLEKEPENNIVFKKIAESYKYLDNDTESVLWYAKLIASQNYQIQDLYNYATALKNTGNYNKAGEILKQYSEQKQEGGYLLSEAFANELRHDTLRFKIALIEQSSEVTDFAPAYFGNKILFASSRQGTDFLHKAYERNGEAYLQLFVADTLPGGQLDSIRPFDNKFNSRYHEGPACFCNADSTMYFTRNNYKIIKGMSSDGQVKLKIYTSKFTYNKWLKYFNRVLDSVGIHMNLDTENWRWVKEYHHSSNEFSVGHPSLTPNGRTIFFASDMPGGKGGTDIYSCVRIGANQWSEPQNMREINTEGNEMFPFIHESGVLFFASDGLPGLGGLDIFKANPKGERFDKPENMGAPINSQNDDFSLIADKDTKTGYFSSNRPGGKGGDDLYHIIFNKKVNLVLAATVVEKQLNTPIKNVKIQLTETSSEILTEYFSNNNGEFSITIDGNKTYQLLCTSGMYLPNKIQINPKELIRSNDTIYVPIALDYYGIYGNVFLKPTLENVSNVDITCKPSNGSTIINATSDSLGNFKILLQKNTDYELIFSKKDFFTLRENYSTSDKKTGWMNVNEYIHLELEKIEVNKTVEIPNIYYDLGKWDIRDDAAIELGKVVVFMNDNPTIKIELGSHTDSQGSSKSNQTLSQKRADSSVSWIVNQGISKDRISAKGYGENKIKNHCTNGVKCSESEHQENRRTEIKITSI